MLPTIVFFLALYFSWVLYKTRDLDNSDSHEIFVDQIFRCLTFGLWSYLFYLLH